MESARKKAKLSRSQDTNRVVKAALEGGHYLLACVFHSIVPDKYAFRGKKEVWYEFKEPRGSSLGRDTTEIVRIIDNKLKTFVKKVLGRARKRRPALRTRH